MTFEGYLSEMYDAPENMVLLHFGGNIKSNSVYYQQEDILSKR